jgi:hypothetical protein
MQGKRFLVPVFVLLFLIGVPVQGGSVHAVEDWRATATV